MKHLISTLTLLVALGSGIHALSAVPSAESQNAATDLSKQDLDPIQPVLSGISSITRYHDDSEPIPVVSAGSGTQPIDLSATFDLREEQAGDFFIGGRLRRRPIVRVVRPIYIRPRPRRRRPRRRPERRININGANGEFNYGGNGGNGGNIRVGLREMDLEGVDDIDDDIGVAQNFKREEEIDVNGWNGGYNVNYGSNGGYNSRSSGGYNYGGYNGGYNYVSNGSNGESVSNAIGNSRGPRRA